ncbi:MAG: peptide MFS transporter [Saprospirales bacterium]|nr:peptide MFS transporter [Saprospirales bacterium]MBK8489524.1 peptide MFS transporter [Saprospirales bacterium]
MATSLFSKHPKGLPYLFLTEMWERFGFYLMIGIFMLYMINTDTGGLGFPKKESADIYGTFIALVYLTPFMGGLLADRLLGYRVSITIGGVLLGLGYMALAIPGMTAFWGALFLIIVGNGFFKPNISTLLGNLYNDPQYKVNKDAGYNIFYMGINIGAFICNFIAAYLRNHYGWGYAFAAAGIGMFVGVAIFWLGNKNYAHADVKKEDKQAGGSVGKLLGSILLPAMIAGALGWFIPGNIFGTDSTDAFLFATIPVIIFFLNMLIKAPAKEKQPIAALLSIYLIVILFWAIFKQNGTALTIWAESYTDREIPTAMVPVTEGMGMVQVLTNAQDTFPAYDKNFRTEKDAAGKVVTTVTTHPYFINAPEKLPAEGNSVKLISTEIFQSINPFFVIVLTPVVVLFFAMLRQRKREPTTAAKVGWGLLITSLSSLVMVAAVYSTHNGLVKGSGWWLIGTYGVVTIGELCLSPMGLSLVNKLAPARIAGLMMGGWFLATSIGNKLSGVLASLWDVYDHKANFFWVNTGLTLIAALAVFVILRWLNRVLREHGA